MTTGTSGDCQLYKHKVWLSYFPYLRADSSSSLQLQSGCTYSMSSCLCRGRKKIVKVVHACVMQEIPRLAQKECVCVYAAMHVCVCACDREWSRCI